MKSLENEEETELFLLNGDTGIITDVANSPESPLKVESI